MKKMLLIPAGLLILFIGWPGLANAQGQLRKDQVTTALTAKLERGLSGPDLWNTGYDFYRLHPPTPETARQIHLGFKAARGLTAKQKNDLSQAAAYWLKIYQEGPTTVVVGRETWWYDPYGPQPRRSLDNPLRMTRPAKPGPYGDAPRRPDAQRARQKRSYPGPYYPGVYPP